MEMKWREDGEEEAHLSGFSSLDTLPAFGRFPPNPHERNSLARLAFLLELSNFPFLHLLGNVYYFESTQSKAQQSPPQRSSLFFPLAHFPFCTTHHSTPHAVFVVVVVDLLFHGLALFYMRIPQGVILFILLCCCFVLFLRVSYPHLSCAVPCP
ncbi:hypothetical protein BU16DRAFT_142421 [Lophium mytilinum]|uniref:Transmembrane protein n=1 Tax=Lophium mytilinum TaxID=390894 RepID=A0A6A6QF75_9PEZI|nr:hypothetical protein BU16DRAFT_142421 [Lophium mytilinum]